MADDTNVEVIEQENNTVTVTEETINVAFDTGFVTAHSTRHEEGGVDEVDLDKLNIAGTLDLEGFDLVDAGDTIWDATNEYVPNSALEGSGITINANDGLVGGGTVGLGDTVGLDIEPTDFAGVFLSDDGADNLTVDIGSGLEDDGSGNIQFDEDTAYTLTSVLTLSAGADTQGDITDGTQVIWDASAQEVPDSALGTVDAGALNIGDGLKDVSGVVAVEPANIAGLFLSDDGSDNLTVDIGRGLEDDGTGAIQFDEDTAYTLSSVLTLSAGADTKGDITDGTQVIWDASAQEVPDSALGTVDNTTLANDSVTVNANDGLVGGGTVALGGTIGLDIEPADFAGAFVQDDGADNIEVLIGRGLEDDGSGNIRVDEDTDYTFTSAIDFSAGLDTQGDITDGTQVIWDVSSQEIPDSAMGSIDNATLTNDSVTVSAGDGVKGGGTVALGGSTTINVEPADFAGFGVVDDGSDNVALDETVAPTWTGQHTFNGGVTLGSNIDAQSTYLTTNLPSPTNAGDSARKAYVDSVAQGLELKDSVDIASTGNIDLTSATDPNPIDGYTLSNGESILLKDQTTASENGIYVANTATDPTTWTRRADFDEDAEVVSGSFTFVEKGTNQGNSSYIVSSNDPITVGTDDIIWTQFGSAGEITAGDGLKKSGQTLNIEPADFAGTYLSDDGADNLTVDLGRGLENDGSGNVQFDEDTAYTFTSTQTFDAEVLLNQLLGNATYSSFGNLPASPPEGSQAYVEDEDTIYFYDGAEWQYPTANWA